MPVFWPGEFHGLYGVAKSQTRLSDFHFILLPVGHCKISAKVHSNTGIHQETRKKSNIYPNSTPKATGKGRNEEHQG